MKRSTKPALDHEFVGWRLLVPLVNALWEAQDRALDSFDLTARQGAMLLACAIGKGNTPAKLAYASAVEVSTVTRMLDRLEGKGLLRRERSKADRRQVLVSLTAAGERMLAAVYPTASEVARTAWKGVTAQERRSLQRISQKVLQNLEPGPQNGSRPK